MSRPSPVQPFASRLTRPIQSRNTPPDRLTASQASRRMTPRLTTTLTTTPFRSSHQLHGHEAVWLRRLSRIRQLAADQPLLATGETSPKTERVTQERPDQSRR